MLVNSVSLLYSTDLYSGYSPKSWLPPCWLDAMTTRARREKSHARARSSSRARAGAPSIFHRCTMDLTVTPPASAGPPPAPPSAAGPDSDICRSLDLDRVARLVTGWLVAFLLGRGRKRNLVVDHEAEPAKPTWLYRYGCRNRKPTWLYRYVVAREEL